MKKLFRLLISLILVAITSFSVACNAAREPENYVNPRKVEKVTYQGTHIMTAEEVETEDYIVKNGNLEYQILMPQSPTEYEIMALNEFRLLIKRALGNVPISIVYESNDITEFDESAKFISIGMTNLVELADVDYDADALSYNGVRIATVGKSIFLIGGTWYGVVNAVYDFFQICFNYEIYTKNCIQIDTGVQNLKLKNFDVTDLPDIEYNLITHGPLASYKTAKAADYRALLNGDMTREDVNSEIGNALIRMRFNPDLNDGIVNLANGVVNGATLNSANHTALLIASDSNKNKGDSAFGDTYMNTNIVKNEKWYADSGNQICYTAHGDEDTFEDMTRWFANYFIYQYKKNPPSKWPGCDYVSLTAEDGGGYCYCEHCQKVIADYDGKYSAINIIFCNAVIEIIEEWMELPENEEYKRPKFKLLTYAYGDTKYAPTEYDEDLGKYVTLNDLELNDRICIWNTQYPFAYTDFYDVDQEYKLEDVKAWGDISEHMWSYDYSHYYHSGAFFLDTLNGYSPDRLQFMANQGVTCRFTEIHTGQEVLTTWFNLTTYMIYKQTWNSNYEPSELVENFFNAYFGPAAKTMLRLYYDQKIFTQQVYEQHEIKNKNIIPIGFDSWSRQHYPFQVLKGWVQQTEQAIVDIESYKTIDMDMYQTYLDRIDIEAIQYFHVIHRLYKTDQPYSMEEKERYKERFLRILENYKITWNNVAAIRSW